MIIQALCEYYNRKANDPDGNIAPQGLEWKEIPFIIVLDQNGIFQYLEDTQEGTGKAKRAKSFLVPKGNGRSSNITPNIFWDKVEYVLGFPKSVSNRNRKKAFVDKICEYSNQYPNNIEFAIVKRFYDNADNFTKILKDQNWKECNKNPNTKLSFRIGNSDVVATHKDLHPSDSDQNNETIATCLVTCEKLPISIIHSKIPIIGGSKNGRFISFKKDSYHSYHKAKGLNAPISIKAEFAYTTALNTLLGKDSQNRYQLRDITFVFWSNSDSSTEIEIAFSSFFDRPPKDDPDKNVRDIKTFLDSIKTGKHIANEENTRFNILGLVSGEGRISVQFWKSNSVAAFSKAIAQHFEDLKIIKDDKDAREYFSLFNLLKEITIQSKTDNTYKELDKTPSNLIRNFTQSILDGTPYPATLQLQCLSRIKAERKISYIRAAILKAYLNRKNRFINHLKERDITMALDLENKNQGYLCGRLFAVLESIQKWAHPTLNTTIKDRFYTAASTTPITVFSRLIQLTNHHLEKLSKGGKVYFEKQIQAIMDEIDSSGMPATLSLDDQCRFAIGYYHQRKVLFTKKGNEEKKDTTNN